MNQGVNREEIKELYPGLESIVDILLDNNIEFSHEGETDLLGEGDVVLASAGLLISKYKIAIDPCEGSKDIFETAGYITVSSEDFNVNMIK